jgi:hypothetical protein
VKNLFTTIKKAVFPTAFFLCVLLSLSGCDKTPDEEQIQLVIEEMIAAVEEGKPADIADHLHENFQANRHMDAKQVKQMLVLQGMQHAEISVNLISSQTFIDPVYTDKASTTLSIIVAGFSGRGVPEDGRIRVVKLEWRKDSNWKALKADWEM